jgi:hypothetical protein
MKLRPYGKNGVTGTEDALTMIICTLMTELLNTKISVLVGVYWNYISFPGQKLSQ